MALILEAVDFVGENEWSRGRGESRDKGIFFFFFVIRQVWDKAYFLYLYVRYLLNDIVFATWIVKNINFFFR